MMAAQEREMEFSDPAEAQAWRTKVSEIVRHACSSADRSFVVSS
jgi:hypothetical protein